MKQLEFPVDAGRKGGTRTTLLEVARISDGYRSDINIEHGTPDDAAKRLIPDRTVSLWSFRLFLLFFLFFFNLIQRRKLARVKPFRRSSIIFDGTKPIRPWACAVAKSPVLFLAALIIMRRGPRKAAKDLRHGVFN